MRVALFRFVSRYTNVRFTRTCKLTKAGKNYECSVKGCRSKIKKGDLHWTDQVYRICFSGNHRPEWEREEV